jgi:NAD(P)-dependent dehydrogenase (short-subunit alcohol dehydrogenase family)
VAGELREEELLDHDDPSEAFVKGKTVFITGGAGGLGASAARYLAERGWQVFAADSDARALRALVAEPNVMAVPLDVTTRPASRPPAASWPARATGSTGS